MVRSLHKIKILFAVATIMSAPAAILSSAHAANPESVDLQVNIAEALTIIVTDPTTWASGSLINTNPTTSNLESDFLRNKVNVTAKTNSPIGVTVSMYTKNDTDLRNTTSYSSSDATSYIPTLDATSGTTVQPGAAGATFPTNYWGYSVDDTDTLNTSSHYNALRTSANPIELFTTVPVSLANVGSETSKDVFFGAKADQTKQSGTYARTVYFAAVTGTIDTDNPAVPVNPTETEPINEVAHFTSTPTNQTSYTTRRTYGSGTSSVTGSMDETTDAVTKGNVTDTYAKAYGVTSSTSNNGSAFATAFGVAAGVSAISGLAFFIAAKRKKDDEEEGN